MSDNEAKRPHTRAADRNLGNKQVTTQKKMELSTVKVRVLLMGNLVSRSIRIKLVGFKRGKQDLLKELQIK